MTQRSTLIIKRFVIYGFFLNNVPYIRIARHRIVIFNIVVVDFMTVNLSFRLFIARLIHDLGLNLLNSLNFCGYLKFPFVGPL